MGSLKPMVLSLGLLCLTPGAGYAQAPVEALGDGWYQQRFQQAKTVYLVDTVAHTCFVAYARGVSEVSCRGLNRRPEWNAIISWE